MDGSAWRQFLNCPEIGMIQRADEGANRFAQLTKNNENAAAQNRCASKQTKKNLHSFCIG
jgi:hypothetical protein